MMAKRRVGGTQSHPSEGTKQKTKSQHGTVEKLNPSKALVEISEGGPNRSYYVPLKLTKMVQRGSLCLRVHLAMYGGAKQYIEVVGLEHWRATFRRRP